MMLNNASGPRATDHLVVVLQSLTVCVVCCQAELPAMSMLQHDLTYGSTYMIDQLPVGVQMNREGTC